MEEKGTKIRIVSKHGYSYASMLSVEVVQDNLRISWRSVPEKLGVDMMHLKEIVQSSISDCCLHLLFQGQLRTDCSAATDETDLHQACNFFYEKVNLSSRWSLRMLKPVVPY